MKYKTILILILALAMIFALSGCGGSDEDTALETETAEETAVTEETVTGEAEETVEYDISQQNDAYALSDGDELVGGTYTATGTDESAIEASGSTEASVTGSYLVKSSGDSSSVDGSSFYGINSAVRAYDNSTITLKDVTVEATADNATGVFAYDGATIDISDSTVTVSGGGAGGIQVAGGGTLYAKNLTVTSSSKAAIRSDRGGGVMVVDGGSYTCTGKSGAPAVYSTADITVSNAELTSTQSRAVIIEGKNSVTLNNCISEGNGQTSKEGSINANVLLYQSASGDAANGTSEFTMKDGELISNSGVMFWCTNTSSVINLENVKLTNNDCDDLLTVSAGRWGKDGSNGGKVEFNAKNQTLEGNITVDSVSSLDMELTSSDFIGTINTDGAEGSVSVTLDEDSTWTLTGDSYISSFSGDEDNIITNGYTLYVNGKAI